MWDYHSLQGGGTMTKQNEGISTLAATCIVDVSHFALEFFSWLIKLKYINLESNCYKISGKVKSIKALMNKPYLKSSIEKFYTSDANIDEVLQAGEAVAVALYGGAQDEDLDEYRYKCFAKTVKHNASMLASIPPTKGAMAQHSKRVYLEIQNSLANPKNPLPLTATDFGWRKTPNGLMPIPTNLDPAPQDVLRTIFCSCMKGCGKSCGCRKSGLVCNIACKNCETTECSNRFTVIDDDNENKDDISFNDRDYEADLATNDSEDEDDADYRIEDDEYDYDKDDDDEFISLEELEELD